MQPYIHKVHYYETDRMGITHHSNYIRWMEEARVHFLDQTGWGYARVEAEGMISPVTGVECKYRETTTFDDEIRIVVKVKEFKGVRLVLEYEMFKVENEHLVFTGISNHCFLDANGRMVKIKKEFPEFYQLLTDMAGEK